MDKIIWEDIRLKELINDISDGATPSTLDENNFGKGIPWVVVEDIQPEIWSTQQELSEKGFSNCSAKKWKPGTVIVSTGATIGKVGIAMVELCTKQGITGIVCNDFLIPDFLKYWLEQNTNQLLKYSQGTTIKEIRSRAIKNLRLCLPNPFTKESITVQEKVIVFLTAVDIAIEKTRLSIEKAERLRKSLMQNLLIGKLKPDGTWRKEEEFELTDNIKIPKNWKIYGFGPEGLGNLNPQMKFTKNKEYDFIDMDGIGENYSGIRNICRRIIKDGSFSRFFNNDILVAKITPCLENGKIAIAQNINSEIGFGSTEFIVIRATKNIFYKYLFYLLSSSPIHSRAVSLMEGTTGRQRVPLSAFKKKIKIAIPNSIDEQKEIVSKLDNVQTEIEIRKSKIEKLNILKKSLLQNLLTGKVKIKPT